MTRVRLAIASFAVGLLLLGLGFALRGATTQKEATASRHVESVAYENALSGCETRGNEMRRYVFKIAKGLAKAERAELYEPGREVAHGMASAEYADPADGTVDCLEAIKKP